MSTDHALVEQKRFGNLNLKSLASSRILWIGGLAGPKSAANVSIHSNASAHPTDASAKTSVFIFTIRSKEF